MTNNGVKLPGHSLFYYVLRFPGSRLPVEVPAGASVFSYHKKSGMRPLLIALLLAAIVVMVVLHYFLSMWFGRLAWFATLATLSVALIIMGQIRAIRCRPILIHEGTVWLRNGMYDLASVPITQIDTVQATIKTPVQIMSEGKPLWCCFPTGHNLVISLKKPREANLLFGQRQPFKTALVFVDNPRQLADEISSELPD